MSQAPQETKKDPLHVVIQQSVREVVEPFKSLATSPRALWGLYISYVLEGLVYFGVLTILGKYLSENAGLADLHAGWVYSGLTGGITLAMLFMGGVADKLGVRRALLISLGMMVVGRALLGASGTFFEHGLGPGSPMFLTVVLGLFMVVLGYGMYQPAAYAAVKQFTDDKTSSMGYAMIYGLMNLGAFFSGVLSPRIRINFGIVSVYWVFAGLTILAFLTVFFIMSKRVVERDTLTNIEAKKEDDEEDKERTSTGDTPRVLQPLFTPLFNFFIVGAIASLSALVFLFVSAPAKPGAKTLDLSVQTYKQLGKTLSSATTLEATAEFIRNSANEAGDLAQKVQAPASLPKGASIDAAIFPMVREMLSSDAALIAELGQGLPEEIDCTSDEVKNYRAKILALGISTMSGAYALVSPVDKDVLDQLRSRMKEVDHPPVELSADQEATTLAMAQKEFGPLFADLAEQYKTLSFDPMDDSPGLAAMLEPLFARESVIMQGFATAPEPSAGLRDLAKERLLHSSVLLIEGFGSILKGNEKKETALNIMDAWAGASETFATRMKPFAAAAVQVSGGRRLAIWAQRYAAAWIAMAGFISLLFISWLSKRPDHPFRNPRFVAFIFVLIPVQTLFAHNWLTLPYYINRAFGGTTVGDNFEFFSNINPILIFFLAPLVAALTVKARIYPMMIWGTLVMAVPTFLLVFPPTPFLLITYILLMSIGEAMWQPRFLQWVAEIAPEGETGLYMGIGQFPWFLTKVITGMYSGYFLAQYCPRVGPQNTQAMWLIYALIAMATPVVLWFAKGWMLKGAIEKRPENA